MSLIDPLVDLLQQMMAGMRLCDSTGRVRVGLALEHALLNALYRGNLEISSEDMQTARETLLQGPSAGGIVAERLAKSPYRDRKIQLDICMSPDEASSRSAMTGRGSTRKLPERGDPEALENRGGQGCC